MMFLRTAGLVAITLLLGACATPTRVGMAPEQRAKIQEMKAHVAVVQDEVIVAVQPSQASIGAAAGGALGGLIGAMIDSSVTNKRVQEVQQAMAPFYASIEDVDYRKEFNEAVKRDLAGYPIKITQVDTTPRAIGNASLAALREKLPNGQALLVISPRYYLSMDLRSLDAEVVVSTWTKGAGDSNAPLQRAVLYYQSKPVGPGGKESVALWGAQNAALFRSTLRESIAETIQLILMNNDVPAALTAKPEELKSYAFNTGVQQGVVKGQLVKETATRSVVLGSDLKLYSLPKTTTTTAAAGQ